VGYGPNSHAKRLKAAVVQKQHAVDKMLYLSSKMISFSDNNKLVPMCSLDGVFLYF
jgi:hypothetical protein